MMAAIQCDAGATEQAIESEYWTAIQDDKNVNTFLASPIINFPKRWRALS
jgi:hypothetical protein